MLPPASSRRAMLPPLSAAIAVDLQTAGLVVEVIAVQALEGAAAAGRSRPLHRRIGRVLVTLPERTQEQSWMKRGGVQGSALSATVGSMRLAGAPASASARRCCGVLDARW